MNLANTGKTHVYKDLTILLVRFREEQRVGMQWKSQEQNEYECGNQKYNHSR